MSTNVASINRVLDQYTHTNATVYTSYEDEDTITGWVTRFCYYYLNNVNWSGPNIIKKFIDGVGNHAQGNFRGTNQSANGWHPGFLPEDSTTWTATSWMGTGNSGYFYAGGQGLMTKWHDCQARKKNDSSTSSGGTGIYAAGKEVGNFKLTNIKMGDLIGFKYSRTTAWPKADGVNETITANASTGALSIGPAAI